MRNLVIVLTILFISVSCDDAINENVFQVSGEYAYAISNCDNSQNSEENCHEFVNFLDESKASVLVGGGDIVEVFTYTISGSTIEIITNSSLELSFTIKSNTQIERIQDQSIWVKK